MYGQHKYCFFPSSSKCIAYVFVRTALQKNKCISMMSPYFYCWLPTLYIIPSKNMYIIDHTSYSLNYGY